MGFYPVCPGTDQYVIGSPLFPRVIIYPGGSKTGTIIEAPGNNQYTPYIQEMTINGTPSTKCFLTHEELTTGGKISFKMSNKPNEERGQNPEDKPYSFSTDTN